MSRKIVLIFVQMMVLEQTFKIDIFQKITNREFGNQPNTIDIKHTIKLIPYINIPRKY